MNCLRTAVRRISSSSGMRGRISSFSIQPIQKRSVVFVRGERVKGMLRDPSDYLTSKGIKYGLSEDNIKPLKEFLSKEYELPDKILLQILTHKSFAHGSKPYNEKLSFFGEHLLKYTAAKYVLEASKNKDYTYSIGGYNFDSIGSLAHRLIVTNKTLSEFASDKGIDKIFFCKVALPFSEKEQEANFKPKAMYSTIVSSLTGAIALQHGKATAEKFVKEVLFKDILKLVSKIEDNK